MPAKKRPKKKQPPRGRTTTRSVRFSDAEWSDIERKALVWGISPTTAIRQQALIWARKPD